MSGRRSRTKGHSFERTLAIMLRHLFPRARRHLEYQDGQAKGCDLAETGRLKFQCKKHKKYVSIALIKEIELDPLSLEIPILVTAGDNQEALAALPLKWFIRILEKIHKYEPGFLNGRDPDTEA